MQNVQLELEPVTSSSAQCIATVFCLFVFVVVFPYYIFILIRILHCTHKSLTTVATNKDLSDLDL